MSATSRGLRWLGGAALAIGLGLGATGADAAYKLHYGWSPRPHFPSPLIAPAPKPNTWIFKTKLSPELEVRRYNFELRVNWERRDTEEWSVPRIFRQMLRLGCDIVDPNLAQQLIDRLYATRSLVPPRDMGARGVAILHRLSVYNSGCVIWMEARGARMHTLRIIVSPPPPPKKKTP
ncbi:MAG: hypothetical protein KIT16_23555 [Rhodospirillaceae bacterium]|nr:hypothetical protein [Rhodospirillaceae bacterium]